MTDELETGELLGHYSCPSCGGSDPLALYEKSNYVDGNCWSNCGHFKPSKLKELGVTDGVKEVLVEPAIKSSRKGGFVMTDEVVEKVNSILDKEIHGWPERRIPALVNEFYGIRSEVEGDGVDKVLLREYCPSYNQKDQLVGWHVRDDKVKQARNNGEKSDRPPFYSIGDVRSSTKLFGQNKFEGGGKTLVIASGQADARAIFTALNTEKSYDSEKGRKVTKVSRFITPVVSTQSGEGSLAQFKANYEWVSSFKSVIIMYDQDDAGREGAEKLARMLKAGQAKIAKLQRKDACEHSKRGEWEAIRGAYFKAEQYSPVDVLHLAEMWDDFEKEDQNIKIPFPPSMVKLNEMMNGGMEFGEVTVVGGLTSIGKTSFVMNTIHNFLENTDLKTGAFFLEGNKREIVRDLISLDLRNNLRLKNRDEIDMVTLKKQFLNNIAARDNFVYVDHQGSISNDEIFDKFNYLSEVENCDIIVFDVLQAACNSSDNSAVINFMDSILKFAKKSDTCVIVVSHMRKPDGDDPHNVSEYHLLGSSAINQIAYNTILLSRSKMHEDKNVANSTKLQLVKCRRTGLTGEAGWIRYDNQTSHFYPTSNPYEAIDEPDESLFAGDVSIDEQDYDKVEEQGSSQDWEVVDD